MRPRRRKTKAILVCILAAGGLGAVIFHAARLPSTGSEAASVYAAVLSNFGAGYLKPGKSWTVVNATTEVSGDMAAIIKERLATQDHSKDLDAGTRTAWLHDLHDRRSIPAIETRFPVQMISPADVQYAFGDGWWFRMLRRMSRMPAEGWWEDYYKTFPNSNGITEFSVPTFNRSRTRCLVYYSHSAGGLAGEGLLIYLEKVGGLWHVKWADGLWES